MITSAGRGSTNKCRESASALTAMAEPETVTLEIRQAGLGSESCHSTSKYHQAAKGTKQQLAMQRSSGGFLDGPAIGHPQVIRFLTA